MDSGAAMEAEQERRVYSTLAKVATMEAKEVAEVVNWVVRRKLCGAQAWYNLLLYVLEREPTRAGRSNVVRIISGAVLGEWSTRHCRTRLTFTELVKKGISSISHAAEHGTAARPGGSCCTQHGDDHHVDVRVELHQSVFEWIEAGIVSVQFLRSLQQDEARWSFREARPRYSYPASEEAPATFDLVRLGLQGPGYDRGLDMGRLIKQGIAGGLQEGWLTVDRHGHHVVAQTLHVD